MIGARIRGVHEQAAKERMSKGGKRSRKGKGPANLPERKQDSRDAAAEVVKVSGKSVEPLRGPYTHRSGGRVEHRPEALERGRRRVSRSILGGGRVLPVLSSAPLFVANWQRSCAASANAASR